MCDILFVVFYYTDLEELLLSQIGYARFSFLQLAAEHSSAEVMSRLLYSLHDSYQLPFYIKKKLLAMTDKDNRTTLHYAAVNERGVSVLVEMIEYIIQQSNDFSEL